MAKLKGPLFSLGASQQLGKALVYFAWKGLDVVREYVVPANPRTSGQTTQRGYLTDAVALIHTAQAVSPGGLGATDSSAYALWAAVVQAATTWFNQACRNYIDQHVAGLRGAVFHGGGSAAVAGGINVSARFQKDGANTITAGRWWYGTSRTALINSVAATVAGNLCSGALVGLTTGVKYYMQFRATLHADYIGVRSGIYYDVAG